MTAPTQPLVDDARRLAPPAATEEYVEARARLLEAERDLSKRIEDVAALRRGLPRGPALASYEFAEGPMGLEADEPVRATGLADLFGPHDTLLVYHLMFAPGDEEACSMCSMWVDG